EAAYDVFWYYGDYGQYEYLNACLLALNGKYWEAYQAFENLDYLDSEERAKACIQKWPNNGVLWKNKSYSSANTELTIAVYASSDSAMFIKLYNGYNYDHVASLFIGGSGKATVSLPSGHYIIKDGVGSLWFGPEDAFGYYGDYETMTFDDGSQIAYFENGYGYTLSINIETATGGKGVGSEYESYEGFVGI
ncbi:MAG: hypothetical protein HUK24_06550, partial [Sphaerochaetaceae bacterium]|nr:hypothetical protein [Sphaerochaetaceae bacterium]